MIMTPDEFDAVMQAVSAQCRDTLCKKGEEYSRNGDRLWNFKVAAAMQKVTPEKALWGMLAKHIVSLQDITDHPEEVDPATFYEKSQDAINYLILLIGLMKERWACTK